MKFVVEKERLQWLDAMRGFTMILVVAYHVAQMSFGINEKTSASLPFLVLFRMPLFFFVSGFLAYKADFQWTWPNALRLTWKKVKIQVLPTLVFLCVFIVLRRPEFWGAMEYALKSPTKMGYWFTWVLLQMFVIYYLACLLQRFINSKFKIQNSKLQHWCIWVLWGVSIVAYELLYQPGITFYKEPFFRYSSLIKTMNFLQFFVFGNLVHRYWEEVQKVADSPWFFPLLTLVAFVSCADFFRWHNLQFEWTNLPRTVAMYSLLIMVVVFFRYYQTWFSQERPIGRGLQYIGVRKIDIYLLHYILLPKMPAIGVWFNQNRPNFVLEVVCTFALALVVIVFCLLVSQVLRISPLFRQYLFGRK